MAQKVHIQLEDDIDGGPAEETITFALDGRGYEIELSASNTEKLREALGLGQGARPRGLRPRSHPAAPQGRLLCRHRQPVLKPGYQHLTPSSHVPAGMSVAAGTGVRRHVHHRY